MTEPIVPDFNRLQPPTQGSNQGELTANSLWKGIVTLSDVVAQNETDVTDLESRMQTLVATLITRIDNVEAKNLLLDQQLVHARGEVAQLGIDNQTLKQQVSTLETELQTLKTTGVTSSSSSSSPKDPRMEAPAKYGGKVGYEFDNFIRGEVSSSPDSSDPPPDEL